MINRNIRCFEIEYTPENKGKPNQINRNIRCFEITNQMYSLLFDGRLTVT